MSSSHLWLALPLLALPALLPLITRGLTASADGMTHLIRIALLVNHWQEGVFYPRWMPELVTGLGYPVVNFYAPATYYLAGALQLLGATTANALLVSFAFFVIAGGLGMYFLARELYGAGSPWAALVAGAAYMYAPYLLANVFVRGAIAEVGAQALLPWILWCGRRVFTANRPVLYVAFLALSLGALAVTHTVTLIIFPPFLLGYLLTVWWQRGHQRARLGWMAAGIGAAMGLSAFFWLPLIGESGYLSQDAFGTSIEIFVPENLWQWQTFLDLHLQYEYTFAVPYQLGLGQTVLAVAGLFFVRRWDKEWLYLLLATALACVAMGVWAEALWLSNRVSLAVQFPWRLLAIVSLTLPLFTGAIAWHNPSPRYPALVASALLLLIILFSRPQVDWMGALETENGSISLPAIARHEAITGQLGTGPTREFMPRWSEDGAYLPEPTDAAIDGIEIALQRSDGHGLEFDVASPTGGALRFTNLYFPGWQATLDDTLPLEPYPSTNLGLLTLDVPPGSHQLRLTNVGTPLQRWATWLTLATLVGLIVLTWRARLYWLFGASALLLLVGSAALMRTPQPALVQRPVHPLQTAELSLLGYRLTQDDPARLLIYPTWYVRQTPQADLRVGWELRDEEGSVVNLTATRPYFNSQRASNWPPGTLVDDAYELLLPAGLSAGTYQLVTYLYAPENRPLTPPTMMGTVDLLAQAPATASAVPANPLSLHFGDSIRLTGYTLHDSHQEPAATGAQVVRPGDTLEYSLYWTTAAPPTEDYHGFVHLVDAQGDAIARADQLPGSYFHPPMTWDMAHIREDTYAVRVPESTPNGLVWPAIGLYNFQDLQRVQIDDDAGQSMGDAFQLPPVKVYGANLPVTPQHTVNALLGEGATLLGYDLELPGAELQPGNQFTLTLYYRGQNSFDTDLTQFIHLSDPAMGMAAQHDAPPLNGANPTSTWQPGEIVVDRFTLQISEDASPGVYTLGTGMYNLLDGIRVPVTDAVGRPLPDYIAPLTKLYVEGSGD